MIAMPTKIEPSKRFCVTTFSLVGSINCCTKAKKKSCPYAIMMSPVIYQVELRASNGECGEASLPRLAMKKIQNNLIELLWFFHVEQMGCVLDNHASTANDVLDQRLGDICDTRI